MKWKRPGIKPLNKHGPWICLCKHWVHTSLYRSIYRENEEEKRQKEEELERKRQKQLKEKEKFKSFFVVKKTAAVASAPRVIKSNKETFLNIK